MVENYYKLKKGAKWEQYLFNSLIERINYQNIP